ncbi:MAG: ABC transporter substrate-binding protein [Ignavibacteriaceae bacterium]
MSLKRITLLLLFIAILPSCNKENSSHANRVVIGISSDIQSTNPLFSFTVDEGNVSELLYLSLVQFDWDAQKGEMIPKPMLAKDWQWNKDSTSITFDLRNNVYWSDGVQFTASDVVYSFDVYSDPVVQSSRYGMFKSFYSDSSLHINLKKTFIVDNPFELTVNLKKGTLPNFNDLNVPLIPEHVFKKIDRKNLITAEKEMKLITDGPFYVSNWEKNQAIILKANEKSFLHNPKGVSELIFKVVPDYSSRITQLKRGEIDLMEDVEAGDVAQLEKISNLKISPIQGRDYDYVAWNNIDPEAYKKNKKVIPNKIFGDEKVREALTYAINRQEILKDFLNDHGEVAAGPVSPIFKNALDTLLKPPAYDPDEAKKILAEDGWKDVNQDGILEKGNQKLSFTFYIPGGNPRREYAATVIKNDLKKIGVDIKIESLEPQVFFEKMFAHEFNAWMAGWSVAIPLDLKSFWYSDLKNTPLNVSGYQSKAADLILNQIEREKSSRQRNQLYKKFQELIYKDNPVTFLYWVDNIVAYNSRIKNINITPLGAAYHCWNWSVNK